MDISQILAPHIATKLSDGLQKRERFDVTHRAANLPDHHVGATVRSHTVDACSDFTRDVRNDLYRAAVVVTSAFLVDHRLIDRSGCHAVQARHGRVREAFVVPQIQIGLGAVFSDEHLAMLKRTHRARIDVEVWIELED